MWLLWVSRQYQGHDKVNENNNYCLYTEDHIQQMIVVNVTAGVMTQSFTVPIVDNNIVECNETFIVTILSVTTCGVTIGNNYRSEMSIADDDGKWKFILSLFSCYIISMINRSNSVTEPFTIFSSGK